MAKTAEQVLQIKGQTKEWRFPVASGETIYKGTIAVLDDDGYLRNLASTYKYQAKLVVFVADGSANATPAATTSAGSISGSLEVGSDDAGDKTTRLCYLDGFVRCSFTSIAQKQIGKTVYASDNFTVDETQADSVKIGTLMTYIDADEGWVELNKFYQHDGTIFLTQAISRSSTAGGLFNILNPTGATIIIERVILDITAGTSGAGTIDVGVAATLTSNDALIDGVASSTTGVKNSGKNAGTNGTHVAKCTSAQYITGTLATGASGSLLAGTVGIWYRYYE